MLDQTCVNYNYKDIQKLVTKYIYDVDYSTYPCNFIGVIMTYIYYENYLAPYIIIDITHPYWDDNIITLMVRNMRDPNIVLCVDTVTYFYRKHLYISHHAKIYLIRQLEQINSIVRNDILIQLQKTGNSDYIQLCHIDIGVDKRYTKYIRQQYIQSLLNMYPIYLP
jgi:hypothetical protein